MDHELVANLCEAMPSAEVTTPFGPDNLVYKVGGKIFAALSLDLPRLNLKCEPERAAMLREVHPSVEEGYHMNKRHWISVYWEREELGTPVLRDWIAHSHGLVTAGLSAKLLRQLGGRR